MTWEPTIDPNPISRSWVNNRIEVLEDDMGGQLGVWDLEDSWVRGGFMGEGLSVGAAFRTCERKRNPVPTLHSRHKIVLPA